MLLADEVICQDAGSAAVTLTVQVEPLGNPVSADTPEADGPRQCGQLSA